MARRISQEEGGARRENILIAARWCFLNFGFSKTSLDDIAKRANISRTLLYKTFKDKEDIFTAVFAHWLVARHPAALRASTGSGSTYERLLEVCHVMLIEPWSDMVGAPMSGDFYDVCERLDPEIVKNHRQVTVQCVASVIEDQAIAEVFVLALDGLLGDNPTTQVLEQRVQLLAAHFTPAKKAKGKGHGEHAPQQNSSSSTV